ncbi:MAG: hypothetical protein JWP01_1024 [Myxococcales bacterium]|nr:hypothetical protein [Myxococcales bacterium]
MRRAEVVLVVLALAGCDRVFQLEREETPVDIADAALRPGLIVWYPMDELDGNRLRDATGRGHDGLCAPETCPLPVAGVRDGALSFNGTKSLIYAASAPDLEQLTSLTVAVWIRPEGLRSGVECFVSKRYGTGLENSWQLCLRDNAPYVVTTAKNVVASSTLTAGWHHVAMRWDGTSVSLTVDAIEVASADVPPIVFGAGELEVGADVDFGGTVAGFAGTIDDVQIFDRMLTSAELLDLVAGP